MRTIAERLIAALATGAPVVLGSGFFFNFYRLCSANLGSIHRIIFGFIYG
jgi:hypothetical protein